MKYKYLTLFAFSIILISAAIHSPNQCHIFFDLSPKFRKTEESNKGDHRVYYDSKNSFSLVVNKYAIGKPHLVAKDSILLWSKDKDLLEETFTSEDEKLNYNNVEVEKYSFMELNETINMMHIIYVFPSNSHLYKMAFSFKGYKEDKCLKEMEKILESLTLDCG